MATNYPIKKQNRRNLDTQPAHYILFKMYHTKVTLFFLSLFVIGTCASLYYCYFHFKTNALFQASVQRTKHYLLHKIGTFAMRIINLFQRKTLIQVEYGKGYNILPAHLHPIKMKILEDDDEKYMISLYMAKIETEFNQYTNEQVSGRADIFTYIEDKDGKTGLFLLDVLIGYPSNPNAKAVIKKMLFFAIDPIDFSVGYEHKEVSKLIIGETDFFICCPDAEISMRGMNKAHSKPKKWDRHFINANSQIYRGRNGTKNTNFFNQSFIDARVTRFDIQNVNCKEAAKIFPLFSKLISVQYYEGMNGLIVWYIETA